MTQRESDRQRERERDRERERESDTEREREREVLISQLKPFHCASTTQDTEVGGSSSGSSLVGN